MPPSWNIRRLSTLGAARSHSKGIALSPSQPVSRDRGQYLGYLGRPIGTLDSDLRAWGSPELLG